MVVSLLLRRLVGARPALVLTLGAVLASAAACESTVTPGGGCLNPQPPLPLCSNSGGTSAGGSINLGNGGTAISIGGGSVSGGSGTNPGGGTGGASAGGTGGTGDIPAAGGAAEGGAAEGGAAGATALGSP